MYNFAIRTTINLSYSKKNIYTYYFLVCSFFKQLLSCQKNCYQFLVNFFNKLLPREKMPGEWRRSVLVLLYKGKGDIKECENYRRIKLMSHTMKLWERVIEARIRKKMTISEQQFGFVPGRSTTDAIFCLRMLLEKWTEGSALCLY